MYSGVASSSSLKSASLKLVNWRNSPGEELELTKISATRVGFSISMTAAFLDWSKLKSSTCIFPGVSVGGCLPAPSLSTVYTRVDPRWAASIQSVLQSVDHTGAGIICSLVISLLVQSEQPPSNSLVRQCGAACDASASMMNSSL